VRVYHFVVYPVDGCSHNRRGAYSATSRWRILALRFATTQSARYAKPSATAVTTQQSPKSRNVYKTDRRRRRRRRNTRVIFTLPSTTVPIYLVGKSKNSLRRVLFGRSPPPIVATVRFVSRRYPIIILIIIIILYYHYIINRYNDY